MELLILALILLVVWMVVWIRSRDTPACDPLPPPMVMDTLGADTKTLLGVETNLIRSLYSVVEPPSCVPDPERPHSQAVPDFADVDRIVKHVAHEASRTSPYTFIPGNIVHNTVFVDGKGEGEFYVTCMMHEKRTATSIRVSLKARMSMGADESPPPPRILHMNFDPQDTARLPTEPCRSGTVPSADNKMLHSE